MWGSNVKYLTFMVPKDRPIKVIQVINAHPISIEEFVQLRSEIEAGSCASSDFGETDWLVFPPKTALFRYYM